MRKHEHGQVASEGDTSIMTQVEDVTRVSMPTVVRRSAAWVAAAGKRWPWLHHWEFWLALALGAFLRFWHIDLTQFLDDQANLMTLARDGVLQHALPVTGFPYSIGTYSPPLVNYLLMPFTLFSPNPMPVAITMALAQTLAVAPCYAFTLRYFGRGVAGTATLLYATSGTAVLYSRFLWQPNLLPLFALLWACTLYARCVRGRRGWLAPNVVLLVCAILVHPTAIVLIPVTALAVLLAPVASRWWEYALAGVAAFVLVAPSIIFEIVSHGFDISRYLQYSRTPATISLTVVTLVWSALDSSGAGGLMQGTPFAFLASWFPLLSLALFLLVASGFALLSLRVVRPAMRIWHTVTLSAGWRARLTNGVRAVWHGLREDAVWRANLLLWLWFTLPLAAQLRYSSPPQVHYLLLIYPALFIVAALPLGWLLATPAARIWEPVRTFFNVGAPTAGTSALTSQAAQPAPTPGKRGNGDGAVLAFTVILVALLVAVQTVCDVLPVAALAEGHFVAYAFNGYPLSEMQAADRRIAQLQHDQAATAVFFSAPQNIRYRAPLDYLLVREHPDRVELVESCLLLPAPGAGPALVISTEANTPAVGFLSQLPNAVRVAEIPLAGGAPWPVFRIAGAPPALSDEMLTGGVAFHDTAGAGLRLDAVALTTGGLLRLRWTVLESGGTAVAHPWYRITAQAAETTGAAVASAEADCQPSRWQAGETLYTWLPLTSSFSASGAAPSGPVTIAVNAGTTHEDLEPFGPLLVLTARNVDAPLAPLRATAPPTAAGAATPEGAYLLPLGGSAQP
jgi:4-amino-4-deoxy-L-arabinose transferase-like glycosyltransferase